jgi:nitrate reductase gamma subunit
MYGVGWLVLVWGAIAVLVVVVVWRMVRIARQPLHLRWELAPIPHEKGKRRYGGSYLEEHEWWTKKRTKAVIAPVLYMAEEILLLRGVWRGNRSLWPFSFALHSGMYLLILTVLTQMALTGLSVGGVRSTVAFLLGVASFSMITSCVLGSIGAVGLILKRGIGRDLRWSNSTQTFLNLAVLGAVFVSGLVVWCVSADPAKAVSGLAKDLLSFDTSLSLSPSLAIHVGALALCCVYLPFTSMMHFAAKYFMYHGVRWNDEPLNERMEREVEALLAQHVTWSERHTGLSERTSWTALVAEGTEDEEV